MEIFGIGLPEMLMIAVVALIVMGPDRLPEAARTLGRAVYDFRKAIEPARSAWDDVQKQIAGTLDVQSAGSSASATRPSGNPWTVHPLAEGMSPEERELFFKTGELPEWKRTELVTLDRARSNGSGPESTTPLAELDYPMPHAEAASTHVPTTSEPLEDLSYPEPGQSGGETES